ncbi:GDSL family lipase [Paenibacillus sp. IB182496]|uniref:GDSL family lipase n=1 Tax=Paenibacillus sabuli TaxID=2772509 RepID=A0A927BWC6_9BACL|nr:GDSL-type esterase/lipase family protein [Paenibacillus sabuli]MBD2846950.1 GDSL family lipase [Paenibacillus sabuli]
MNKQADGTTRLWRWIGGTALAATLALGAGFGYAVYDLLNPPSGSLAPPPGSAAQEEQAPQREELRIVALGDSLTKGVGDEAGGGYVDLVIERLEAEVEQPVTLLNNLAVSGQRADELAERLTREEASRLAVSQANVILLTIGGNDLSLLAQGGGSGQSGPQTEPLDPQEAIAGLEQGVTALGRIVAELHALSPEAQIVYLGLYNPFYGIEQLQGVDEVVAQWDGRARALARADELLTFVPVFDLFEHGGGRYVSNDRFHPNHAGYARMAERVVQALE